LGPAGGSAHSVRELAVRGAFRVFGHWERFVCVVHFGVRAEDIVGVQSAKFIDCVRGDLVLDDFSHEMVTPLYSMVSSFFAGLYNVFVCHSAYNHRASSV